MVQNGQAASFLSGRFFLGGNILETQKEPSVELSFDKEFAHAMYEQLHSEINQRLELRQSILTFALLVAASLFGLGLQSWANAVTVLCYPVLALFLSLIWSQHDSKIGQIAAYLCEMEETCLGNQLVGWERWRRKRFSSKRSQIEIPTKGVFLASELLALVLGLARFVEQPVSTPTTVWFVGLMVVDAVALILTNLSLKHERQRFSHVPSERREE